jgi:hypothetical protein
MRYELAKNRSEFLETWFRKVLRFGTSNGTDFVSGASFSGQYRLH